MWDPGRRVVLLLGQSRAWRQSGKLWPSGIVASERRRRGSGHLHGPGNLLNKVQADAGKEIFLATGRGGVLLLERGHPWRQRGKLRGGGIAASERSHRRGCTSMHGGNLRTVSHTGGSLLEIEAYQRRSRNQHLSGTRSA